MEKCSASIRPRIWWAALHAISISHSYFLVYVHQLKEAQGLATGISNISFLPATDIQSYMPASEDAHAYDAVFSNAVLHWCKRNPGGVLEAAKALLKPGGRFAVEFGGHMNMIGESIPAPMSSFSWTDAT